MLITILLPLLVMVKRETQEQQVLKVQREILVRLVQRDLRVRKVMMVTMDIHQW